MVVHSKEIKQTKAKLDTHFKKILVTDYITVDDKTMDQLDFPLSRWGVHVSNCNPTLVLEEGVKKKVVLLEPRKPVSYELCIALAQKHNLILPSIAGLIFAEVNLASRIPWGPTLLGLDNRQNLPSENDAVLLPGLRFVPGLGRGLKKIEYSWHYCYENEKMYLDRDHEKELFVFLSD